MAKSADAFRTISEVADWLGVQTHVLRFWESKFSQVRPVKRAGGRRYYRPADMLLIGGIRKLLHEDGLTIKGVQKILREEGVAFVADKSQPLDDLTAAEIDSDLAPAAARKADESPARPPLDYDAPAPAVVTEAAPEPEVSEPEVSEPEVAAVSDVVEAAPVQEAPIEAAPADSGVSATPDLFEAHPPPPVTEVASDAVLRPEEPKAPPIVAEAADPEAAADFGPAHSEPPQFPIEPDAGLHEAAPDAAEAHDDGPAPSLTPELDAAAAGPAPVDEPVADADQAADQAAAPAAEEVAQPARPRIVDAPDGPAPEDIPALPGVLSRTASARASGMPAPTRDALEPLLARLLTLRDRMNAAGRQSGA
jgi:DNA-binding transcriptional MerR regulator